MHVFESAQAFLGDYNMKISIILPVYNVEEHLPKCLESLAQQTLEDIEIIAVNDGSTDRSGELLDDFRRSCKKKVILRTIPNHGVSYARNLGASLACGEYLWFVDSDDRIKRTACEKLYQKAVKDQNDLVLFGHSEYDGKTIKDFMPEIIQDNFRLCDHPEDLVNISAYPWDKLIRRDLFETIRFPEGIRFEDLPVSLYLAARASCIGVVPRSQYLYRRDAGFLSRLSYEQLDLLKAVLFLKKSLEDAGLYTLYRDAVELVAVRHVQLRFRQLLWNYETGKKDVKLAIVNGCFDFLEQYFPSWKKNPLLPGYLPDYLKSRWYFYGSRQHMLELISKCDGKPERFQRTYVYGLCKLHPFRDFR